MSDLPLISIVVPSYNQGHFLGETLQSLVDQDYPRLEVIVQDGASTDHSVAVAEDFARRHPGVFQVYSEKDRGHAQALNRGFAKTHGEILGFLNSDDTLYPGVLRRVAREIDPARGRYIVFGRSLFTGEGSPYVGVEHPAEFISTFDQLAIWKRGFNTIPQPSTFWHRRVYERCGDFDETRNQGLDYLQFCNFSRHFFFHKVDELWSTYRMHAASISANKTEAEWLDISIGHSRRHWGPWWSPLRWRLALSCWFHNRHLHERARHHARRAESAFAEKRRLAALGEFLRTLALSPSMAWHRLLQPLLAGRGLHLAERWLFQPGGGAEAGGFTGRHGDGWIGPLYEQTFVAPADARRFVAAIQHIPQAGGSRHQRIESELFLDGRSQGKVVCTEAGRYELAADLRRHAGKTCHVTLRTHPFFIPCFVGDATTDSRKLCAQLLETHVETDAGVAASTLG